MSQFFSFCLLVQLWDEVKSKDIELSKDFIVHIEQLNKPSFGICIGLIRSIHKIFEISGIEPFVEYNTKDFNFKKFLKS